MSSNGISVCDVLKAIDNEVVSIVWHLTRDVCSSEMILPIVLLSYSLTPSDMLKKLRAVASKDYQTMGHAIKVLSRSIFECVRSKIRPEI